MPTICRGRLVNGCGPGAPPSHVYARAVASIVIVSPAMLKTVQYAGYGRLTLKVHCVHAPAAAITIACPGPNSSTDRRSAACDTDSVDPLLSESGRVTLHAKSRQENASTLTNNTGFESVPGKNANIRAVPAAMTTP